MTATTDIRAELRRVVAQLGELAERRDELIREGMAAKIRPADLVADSGLTRSRLYQIKHSQSDDSRDEKPRADGSHGIPCSPDCTAPEHAHKREENDHAS